ncbi:hypothetical protein BV20DRAFT_193470 [Pilatotrama ljubarskyi]|nr:hypothetical protein BV20DRAFT_193470 [Pilatotrama ljubarskyi]
MDPIAALQYMTFTSRSRRRRRRGSRLARGRRRARRRRRWRRPSCASNTGSVPCLCVVLRVLLRLLGLPFLELRRVDVVAVGSPACRKRQLDFLAESALGPTNKLRRHPSHSRRAQRRPGQL